MNVTSSDLVPLVPMGVLVLGACLLLLFEVFAPKDGDRSYAARFAVGVFGIGMALSLLALGRGSLSIFLGPDGATLYADDFSRASSALLMAGGGVATLLSPRYAKNARMEGGELYVLMLFSVVGMLVMVMAADLVTFFLGLETMSIPIYALTAMRANDSRASEAALKYFLVGAFATGFLLFGIALVFGATGEVSFASLARGLSAAGGGGDLDLATLGLVLILVGFAFKVAAVPFHMWAPDVYEGAPTPITGFMAVGVKAAAFLALVRLAVMSLAPAFGEGAVWVSVLSGLAVLTVLAGNVLALVQTNVKRMLAYSSISHAGYILIGVVAAARGEPSASEAVLFYLTAYTFTTLGAFGVLTFLERADGGIESERFGAYAGVGYRHPALGAAMIVFMIALAGMPPTGGFFGKLYIFSSAIRAGDIDLALVGVAGSVLSIYYYLRVLVAFYMREHPEPGPTPSAHPSPELGLGVGLCVVLTIALGVMPGQWLDVSSRAGAALRFGAVELERPALAADHIDGHSRRGPGARRRPLAPGFAPWAAEARGAGTREDAAAAERSIFSRRDRGAGR